MFICQGSVSKKGVRFRVQGKEPQLEAGGLKPLVAKGLRLGAGSLKPETKK
jgi:hypothetical protein